MISRIKRSNAIVLIILCLLSATIFAGCTISRASKAIRKTEKAQASAQRKAQKEYQHSVKKHLKLQSTETARRMKETKKRNRHIERVRKGKINIFDRIFYRDN